MSLILTAIPGIPHVQPGDDVGELILHAAATASLSFQPGDIIAIAQKIVSKAEGRQVNLGSVQPGDRAREVAEATGKDPRLVELVLQESTAISRMKMGILIVRHRLGFTSANAGIDRSNVPQPGADETVLLLPLDPDASARQIRQTIQARVGVAVGVIITDSHGRPFRLGTVGVAIGVAGVPALWDRRGEPDLYGYELQHTDVGMADELAAAAGLLMGQASEATPVVLLRGLSYPTTETSTAKDLVRPQALDLYQ
jgi:coenzyme F420-0:L-glutamate ligase/coenzyme F420-1:gamma-L-glutamate ligase